MIFDDPLALLLRRGRRAICAREIAALHGVRPEDVLVTTGASEALHILFFDAAEPGANVVVSSPGFPPTWAIPRRWASRCGPIACGPRMPSV